MKRIEVKIQGVGEGLLMNSPHNMMEESESRKKTKKYIDKEEAEKVAYRNDEKELIIPKRCVKACFLNGASFWKIKRKAAKPIIAGCTTIEEKEIVLTNTKGKAIMDYTIDKRSVVVQRARIIRARPLIENWNATFHIIYDDTIIDDINVLKEILEESGKRVGLLDNRPAKYGENGRFKVVEFKELRGDYQEP
jgi:hypothetical protein